MALSKNKLKATNDADWGFLTSLTNDGATKRSVGA